MTRKLDQSASFLISCRQIYSFATITNLECLNHCLKVCSKYEYGLRNLSFMVPKYHILIPILPIIHVSQGKKILPIFIWALHYLTIFHGWAPLSSHPSEPESIPGVNGTKGKSLLLSARLLVLEHIWFSLSYCSYPETYYFYCQRI